MSKVKKTAVIYFFYLLLAATLSGCRQPNTPAVPTTDLPPATTAPETAAPKPTDELPDQSSAAVELIIETETSQKKPDEQTIILPAEELDPYFQGINGGAVFYIPSESRYLLYNQELCELPSSPCSTFKIISSLIGLETGVIDPENSVYPWNGTTYWNKEWNRDIGFEQAFQVSCIWYFREVIDRAGKDTVSDFLNQLDYGNRDISDWQGHLNTNNNLDDLRGFWVESSLKISPLNQAEVMKTIFESDRYDLDHISLLKQVMLTENHNSDIQIYGKTGMGVANGLCIDAWFTGMAETADKTIYFAVRLDDPQNKETTSSKAKEIAIDILDHFEMIDPDGS